MKTNKTIIITSPLFGQGDEELGAQLMGSFLRKLSTAEELPKEILLYNSGVKLLGPESTVLDAIERLIEKGVHFVACGTCVNFYNLSEQIDPALIGDMRSIIDCMMQSSDTITV